MARRKSSPGSEPRVTPAERRRGRHQRARDLRLLLFAAAVGAAVVLVIVAGVVYNYVYLPNTTVVSVNGQRVSTQEFRQRYAFERRSMENRYQFYRLLASQIGMQPQTQFEITRLGNYLQDAFSLGIQVKTSIIEDILLDQAADSEGVSVSKTDVDLALEAEVAGRYEKVSTAQAAETLAQAQERNTARVEAGEEPLPLPESDVLSDEELAQGLEAIAREVKQDFGMSMAEYRRLLRANLLRQAMSSEIGERDVPKTERQIRPRHILIRFDAEDAAPAEAGRTENQAWELARNLVNRMEQGESFGYLATQYSDDPSAAGNEGNLGWVRMGALVPEFEEVAFSLPVGVLSEPFLSEFGLHIVEVLEADEEAERPSDAVQRDSAQKFNEWLQNQREQAEIVERGRLTNQLPPGADKEALEFTP